MWPLWLSSFFFSIGRICDINFQLRRPRGVCELWSHTHTISGDWLTVMAHTQMYFDGGHQPAQLSHHRPRLSCSSFFDEFKTQLFWAMVVGYGIYFGFCGYLEVSAFSHNIIVILLYIPSDWFFVIRVTRPCSGNTM